MGSRLRRTPLSVKLVAVVLALVAAALIVISVASAFALRSYVLDQADQELARASSSTWQQIDASTLGLPDELSLPSDYFVVVTDIRGQVVRTDNDKALIYHYRMLSADRLPKWPSSADEVSQRLGKAYTARSPDGGTRWRLLVTTRDGLVVTVGRNIDSLDNAIARLIWIDILVGGIVLIMLASIGAAIVRTSLRPLVEIERTAAAIAAGDLTRRIPDPEPGAPEPETELGRLARTLNVMLSQIRPRSPPGRRPRPPPGPPSRPPGTRPSRRRCPRPGPAVPRSGCGSSSPTPRTSCAPR
jgi:two-component system OmpR family sensor kinase